MAKMDDAKGMKGKRNGIVFLAVYFFSWVGGIVGFILSGEDKALKFHSIQSILLGILEFILVFIPFVGWIVQILLWLYGIYLGYEAGMQEQDIEVPYLGAYAKQSSGY